jgi:hypothetical protein
MEGADSRAQRGLALRVVDPRMIAFDGWLSYTHLPPPVANSIGLAVDCPQLKLAVAIFRLRMRKGDAVRYAVKQGFQIHDNEAR